MEECRSNASACNHVDVETKLWDRVRRTLGAQLLQFARRSIAMAPQWVSKSALLVAVAALAQTALAVDPLPASRKYDWTYTGVPGGIPNVTNICATFSSTATAAQINSALNACANGVVYLNAGTYSSLGGTINVIKSGVVLRGAGADQTILQGSMPVEMLTGAYYSSQPLGTAVTAGGAKGTFTITLASVSGISVGSIILIDKTDPAYVQGPQAPRLSRQHNAVTGINGTTLTVRNPWVTDFSSGSGAALRATSAAWPKLVGVENLKIDHTGFSGGTGFNIQGCDSCWIKGVELYNCPGYHVVAIATLNFEFRDSYLHKNDAEIPNRSGLGVYSNNNTSWGAANDNWKIENNIFDLLFPAIELQNGDNAFYIGYNFFYGSLGSGTNGLSGFQVSWTMDSHGGGDYANLWEGNIGEMFGNDGYWGGDVGSVAFRNHLTAVNRHDPTTATQTASAGAKLKRLTYFTSMIGNVMGNSLATYNAYEQSPSGGCPYVAPYELGYPNIGNCDLSDSGDAWNPTPDITYPDANVKGTLFRWGNYDYYNKSVLWNSAEVPTVDTLGGGTFAVPVPADHILPSSYYYSARPAWFNAGVPWPPIGPDVTGGTASFGDNSGHVNDIPAELCWNSRNLASGGTFNAAACYPLSGSATPPPTPPPGLAAPTNIHVTP